MAVALMTGFGCAGRGRPALEPIDGFGDCIEVFEVTLAPAIAAVRPGDPRDVQLDAILANLPPAALASLERVGRKVARAGGDADNRGYVFRKALFDEFDDDALCNANTPGMAMYAFADRLSSGVYQRGIDPDALFATDALARDEYSLHAVLYTLSLRASGRVGVR